MMEAFDLALEFLWKAEGGYSNHPNDRGGATQFGVTQNTYNAYRKQKGLGIQNVKSITRDEAKDLYYRLFWLTIHPADKTPAQAIAAFDWAVNSGPKTALSHYNADVNGYLDERRRFYRSIGHGSQAVFLRGWLNRVDRLALYLKEKGLN